MTKARSTERTSADTAIARRYEKVRAEKEAAARAIDENTERLRALRLAREARDGPPKGKQKAKAKETV